MKTFDKYRVLLWLALLFACGGVFGYYASPRLMYPNCRTSVNGKAPETHWRERRIETLRTVLDLTEEQIRAMEPSFDIAEESLRRLREATATRTREIVKANGKELMPLLTAEQQEKFKQWVAVQLLSAAPVSKASGCQKQTP